MFIHNSFPEAGPTLEQARILEEVTNFAKGKWSPNVIREFCGIVSFHRYKKSELVLKIIKKYRLEKLDFHNPFLIKYIFYIFDEELIPRIEYKSNYDNNESINNLSVCTNCQSASLHR